MRKLIQACEKEKRQRKGKDGKRDEVELKSETKRAGVLETSCYSLLRKGGKEKLVRLRCTNM